MTDFKRRTLTLSSGKQIKLYGNSMAIGASLEIGEGAAPNIFSFFHQQPEEKAQPTEPIIVQEDKQTKEKPVKKNTATVLNPLRLTEADLMEIADYNIRLWMDLKDNLRKHGANSPRVFNGEALR